MNDMPDPVTPAFTHVQDSPAPMTSQPPRTAGRGRTIAALLGVALLAGMLGGAWLMKSYGPNSPDPVLAASDSAPVAPTGPTTLDPLVQVAPPVGTPTDPAAAMPDQSAYESGRIAALEQRMAEINIQARAAGGTASRAEGVLVAFAARRAIERGQTLGYIESELRQRFGTAMPRAVSTIIDASNHPTNADKLRERLEILEPSLMTQGRQDGGLWANFRSELNSLFVVRPEKTVAVDPAQRMLRAKRALDIGRVDRAISEVEKLPGADDAAEWLGTARRFNEAQRALDLIESAAIQDPANLRDFGTETPAPPSAATRAQPAPTSAR